MKKPMKQALTVASAALAISSVAACSSSSKPSPTASTPSAATSKSTPDSSGAAKGKDQSSKVLSYRLPADIATSQSTGKAFNAPLTMHIVGFRATGDSTLLTFYLSGSHSVGVTGEFLDWASMPAFTDPGSKTIYKVNTYEKKSTSGSSDDGNFKCVCSTVANAGGPSDKVVYTAEYPAIPGGTTSVTLTDPRFKTVNVPVGH